MSLVLVFEGYKSALIVSVASVFVVMKADLVDVKADLALNL